MNNATPISRDDDPRDSTNPFGIMDFLSWDHERMGRHYQGADIDKSLGLMREAGAGFVRFDFLWEDIEPARARFVFDKYDRLVDAALANGLKVLALLVYNPVWAKKAWYAAPDVAAYGKYAQTVVHHFKDRIRHWQLWHEPDNPNFWQPQDQMQEYTRLLKHAYPLLKSVDPTCIVHVGGMSRSLPGCLKNIYENGGRDVFDVVAIHPFANPLIPGALGALHYLCNSVRHIQKEYGDETKPLWITEIGCPGMRDPEAAPKWWLGKNPDEAVQADWVRIVFENALEWPGVEKVFWVFFRDTAGHFGNGSDFNGLIRNDFTKKPSFAAYQALAERYREKASVKR